MDIYIAAITLLAFSIARAEAQGVSIHMHSGEGYAADGILFEPATGRPPFPALLLIPGESGVTQRVTDTAQDLSAAGYFVTVVDLNRGQPPDVAEHSSAQAVHDINSALGFLAKQSRVRHDCVGALGWQSGGTYALKLAAADPKICAVAVRGSQPEASLNRTSVHTAVMVSKADAADLRARTLTFFKAHLVDRH